MEKFKPIVSDFPHMLYGADYNPEQWMDHPEILEEDMRLMKVAGVNIVSLGIFSWVTMEPEEGNYDFSFFDEIMDKLWENGIRVDLATPSAGKPAWLSKKYPEVLRVGSDRVRCLHSERQTHCYTSPIYRKKVYEINRQLAERYKNHPALAIWHVSNEYYGECHCDLCQDAFREWLKVKYNNSLDELNGQWWAKFWGHTYTAWDQIESPAPHGDRSVHAKTLDWKRFVTHQTLDFLKNECLPLKELTPGIPLITNFTGTYTGLDYQKFPDYLDAIAWDSYPFWHSSKDDTEMACKTAFVHDVNRSIKNGKPFMLLESTPSLISWWDVNKLKKPGMNTLSSMQAIAHGSDSVMYFQWRKSRGASEKFHGAVVDHCGHEHTRVFQDVASLGALLKKMDCLVGTKAPAEVAIIYDWENRWAIDEIYGLKMQKKQYEETCIKHYQTFWKMGINVDIVDSQRDLSQYKLVIAPMLYMIKPGVEGQIESYVKKGGNFVATYLTGEVNENDLCYLGGFPVGQLKDVFGIWAEEIDSLYDEETNTVQTSCKEMFQKETYQAVDYCELIHASAAQVLAKYSSDFYAGMPAITCNSYGEGNAYYIAFRDRGDFTDDFYSSLIQDLQIKRTLDIDLPDGVTAHMRTDEQKDYIFLENYNPSKVSLNLDGQALLDVETGLQCSSPFIMERYGVKVFEREIV